MRSVLVLVMAAACGGSSSSPRSPAPAAAITVLDPGAEPRQRLRYELAVHVPEREEATFKTATDTAFINTVLREGSRHVELPAIRAVGRLEVTAVTAAGDALVSYEIEDAALVEDAPDPRTRRVMEAELAALKGLRSSWRLSPAGLSSELAIVTRDGRSASRLMQVVEAISSRVPAFPDVEVGIGATWRVTSPYTVGGITWDRTTTFRLTGLAEGTATLTADVVERAGSQALSVEPNASTKLTSASSNGAAELTVPLGKLAPTVTARSNGEANLLIVRGRLRITSTVRNETTFTSKPLATP